MSRIGKTPIQIPSGAKVTLERDHVSVQGPKGTLTYDIPFGITLKEENSIITVETKHMDRASRALHGFVRAHIANLIGGVTTGWTKTLELQGVGYRAIVNGTDLVLSVGFSHQVTISPPPGITFVVQEGKIIVSGFYLQSNFCQARLNYKICK